MLELKKTQQNYRLMAGQGLKLGQTGSERFGERRHIATNRE